MNTHPPFGPSSIGPNSNSFVQKLASVLEHIFQDEDLCIPVIAQQLNMDDVTLWRKTKRYCKTNPQLLLRDFRLAKAYAMLHDPEMRISDIAYDCGFRSITNFSRVFKDKYKVSPLDFRRGLESAG